MLEALKNKNHPEHGNWSEWIGLHTPSKRKGVCDVYQYQDNFCSAARLACFVCCTL
jgi:hypothetical protein